jgi:hypothetical protein
MQQRKPSSDLSASDLPSHHSSDSPKVATSVERIANDVTPNWLSAFEARFSTRRRRNVHASFTLFLVMYIIAAQYTGCETMILGDYYYPQSDAITEPKQRREPRLGDGCYHVFLDVGANVGVHGRFLLEPQKYPNSISSVNLFGKEYGPLDNRDVCVFAFEANSKHWPRLTEVSEAYAGVGWRYHVVKAAVSDQNGSSTFFHQGNEDEKYNEWGFSGAKDLSQNYNGKVSKGGYTVEVPTVRLSEWIRTHIHERLVPEVPPSHSRGSNNKNNDAHSNASIPPSLKPPVLGMKMDIEGFEYVVLPDLILSGGICHFDLIFGEFHAHFAPITQFRITDNNNNDGDGGSKPDANFHRVRLEKPEEANVYGNALTQVMEASRNCPVRWIWSDDETYLRDGQRLPTPSGKGANPGVA